MRSACAVSPRTRCSTAGRSAATPAVASRSTRRPPQSSQPRAATLTRQDAAMRLPAVALLVRAGTGTQGPRPGRLQPRCTAPGPPPRRQEALLPARGRHRRASLALQLARTGPERQRLAGCWCAFHAMRRRRSTGRRWRASSGPRALKGVSQRPPLRLAPGAQLLCRRAAASPPPRQRSPALCPRRPEPRAPPPAPLPHSWSWVARHNPAARHPTDFGLLAAPLGPGPAPAAPAAGSPAGQGRSAAGLEALRGALAAAARAGSAWVGVVEGGGAEASCRRSGCCCQPRPPAPWP
jgi:hypothetical protein